MESHFLKRRKPEIKLRLFYALWLSLSSPMLSLTCHLTIWHQWILLPQNLELYIPCEFVPTVDNQKLNLRSLAELQNIRLGSRGRLLAKSQYWHLQTPKITILNPRGEAQTFNVWTPKISIFSFPGAPKVQYWDSKGRKLNVWTPPKFNIEISGKAQ